MVKKNFLLAGRHIFKSILQLCAACAERIVLFRYTKQTSDIINIPCNKRYITPTYMPGACDL